MPGPQHASGLAQLATDWIGDRGFLRRLSYQNRLPAIPRDRLSYKGRVANKRVEDSNHIVELEVWEENQRGEVCTPGTATVILPSRA